MPEDITRNFSVNDWSRFESAVGSYTAEVEQHVLKNIGLALQSDGDSQVCSYSALLLPCFR